MPNKQPFRLPAFMSLLGLGTLLAGLIIVVALPKAQPKSIIVGGILALGVFLLVIAAILDFRKVAGAVTGRRGKFSAGSTVMASIFFGIVLLVNAISIGAYQRFDTTGLSKFTLTSQTKDALTSMNSTVEVLGFLVPDNVDPFPGLGAYTRNLLKEYQNVTPNITYKEIDPQENPDQAVKYGVRLPPTIVFQTPGQKPRVVPPEEFAQQTTDAQGNSQVIPAGAENAFTSAILEVTGVAQKKIYFVTGHGEVDIGGEYGIAAQELRNNLFKVETLDLLLSRSIPEDATALIIAGPQRQLSVDELEIVHTYLTNGGWVMVMLNPNPSIDMKALLLPWGINLADGVIVDPSSSLQGSVNSPIVPRLRNSFGMTSIYFPGATALMPLPIFDPQPITGETSDSPIQVVWLSDNTSLAMLSLARTSSESWLETSFEPDTAPTRDEAADIKGPHELALRIVLTPPVDASGEPTGEALPTRLVVVGDSDFATNQNFFNGNNGDFFLNLVDQALTQGKQLISIQRRVLPFRRLVVSPDVAQFIVYSSIALVPVLVLLAGGVIWWRRR